MVDRVKPQIIVHGLVHGFVHGFVHGLVYGLIHGLVYGTWFMVSLILFFLNMVDYPLFFSSRSVVLEASI